MEQLYYLELSTIVDDMRNGNHGWDDVGTAPQMENIVEKILDGSIPNLFRLVEHNGCDYKLKHALYEDDDGDSLWWYPEYFVKQVVQTLFKDDNEFLI